MGKAMGGNGCIIPLKRVRSKDTGKYPQEKREPIA